ncbi:TPA: hypothetical protein BOS_14011 [Bos taurus]|nr:TPA: hypothetical protein BOS_14011 [Bos taurus]
MRAQAARVPADGGPGARDPGRAALPSRSSEERQHGSVPGRGLCRGLPRPPAPLRSPAPRRQDGGEREPALWLSSPGLSKRKGNSLARGSSSFATLASGSRTVLATEALIGFSFILWLILKGKKRQQLVSVQFYVPLTHSF